MGQKKDVIKNSFFYTIGNLLLKAFSFFLIPLYTSYLSPEQYGILNLANSFSSVLTMVFMMGLQYSVIRFFADYKEDRGLVAKMFGTVICFILALGVLISAVLILLRNYWIIYVFEDVCFFPVVLLAILISVVHGLYTVYQDILKGMQDAKRSILLTYFFFFLMLGSNIYTVVVLKMGASGILYSTLMVNAIMLVLMFIDLYKRCLFVFTIDKFILKELLKYSLPLVPHTMAYTISNYATRLVISNKMSLSMLGVYSLASQFGNLGDVILNSIQSAFQPWMFNRMNDTDGRKSDDIAKTSYMLMWVYGLFFILIGVFSQEAIILMASESYIEAWIYVPFIVMSIAIKSPMYFYNNFLYYDKTKTKYIFYISASMSLVCILLTWLFVPIGGIYGAIGASIFAMILRIIATVMVVRNTANEYYSLAKLEILSIVPLIFMWLALLPSLLHRDSVLSLLSFIYKIIVIIIYMLLVIYLYKKEIKQYYFSVKSIYIN